MFCIPYIPDIARYQLSSVFSWDVLDSRGIPNSFKGFCTRQAEAAEERAEERV